ncbi:MAG TPA: MoaD/ThiS family protein [Candidatus Acidoferrales bacterium]|nr:MoaD/ThiS family protein [Candidatus Acidoferrales bacterium]
MVLTIKFIGAMRHLTGKTQLTLNYEKETSLKELLVKISQETPALEKSISDQQTTDSNFNALILVNGREISVLNGLETKLYDGDELVFIPVVHGG